MQASLCSGVCETLRRVDRGRRAHVDHAERRDQHAGVGVLRPIGRSERVADVPGVVGIEQAVGEDAAQQALIEVVMRVDEAGQHDAVRGVDHGGIVTGHGDLGLHVPNLPVLDQHIGLCEVADRAVERQHNAAPDQDAWRSLRAGELDIRCSPLGTRKAWQHLRGRPTCRESCTRRQQRPPRWRYRSFVFVVIAH
jgi:hypothetical protein